MKTGIVVKAYSGFYYVKEEDGHTYECKLRGRFKLDKNNAIPGDKVTFEDLGNDTGVIEEILPRSTLLNRPMVANVDQVIITFSAKEPALHYKLLDQFLVMAEASDLHIIICLNKIDQMPMEESKTLLSLYEEIGYQTVFCSAKTGIGIENLRAILQNKISVFAGASGVGKSALLNAVQPGMKLVTGNISEKIKRGKHTTRYVELLQLNFGGMVADTPGFSFFEMEFLVSEELLLLFPEMREFLGNCRFQNCIHAKEPGCGIKEAVQAGKIALSRYESYLAILESVRTREREERGY